MAPLGSLCAAPRCLTGSQGEGDHTVLLKIENLSKRFGGLLALKDLCLEVAPGELRGIIGPNGSGKSTLFNLIAGRYRPSSGDILVDGRSIVKMRPDQRTRLGITIKFQVTNVFNGLSVMENILLGFSCSGRLKDQKRGRSVWGKSSERALELLEQIGLESRQYDLAGSLSHGEKQWLEIGMALATHPSILLLDEPTSGMGPEETKKTAEIVKQLKGNLTILIIEHDMDFVRSVSERITVLDRGLFLTEGTYAEIKTDDRVIKAYLGKGRQRYGQPPLS